VDMYRTRFNAADLVPEGRDDFGIYREMLQKLENMGLCSSRYHHLGAKLFNAVAGTDRYEAKDFGDF